MNLYDLGDTPVKRICVRGASHSDFRSSIRREHRDHGFDEVTRLSAIGLNNANVITEEEDAPDASDGRNAPGLKQLPQLPQPNRWIWLRNVDSALNSRRHLLAFDLVLNYFQS